MFFVIAIIFFTLPIYAQVQVEEGQEDECYQEIIQDMNKEIAEAPTNAELYITRGNAKYYLDDFRGAMSDYKQALENNESSAEAYCRLGMVKLQFLNQFEESLADFEKSIELNEKYALAYYGRGLAKIAKQEDDKEGGCADLSKAGELGEIKAYQALKNLCKSSKDVAKEE